MKLLETRKPRQAVNRTVSDMEALKTRDTVSYQDVLDAPEGMIAEILDGELVMQACPREAHEEARDGLSELLRPPFQRGRGGPGGWWIRTEREIHLGDRNFRTIVPDIAGWRKERIPIPPETYSTVAPDWVCEILSPSTARIDRTVKMPLYAEVGVGNLWLVDPVLRIVESYVLREGSWTLLAAYAGEEPVEIAPFDGLSLALEDIWLPEPPDTEPSA